MTAYDPAFHTNRARKEGGFLRLLGLSPAGASARSTLPEVLGNIGAFLERHDLDVTSFTLSIAYDVVTGADLRLSRLIDQECAAGHAVTVAWLENVRNLHRSDDGSTALRELMDRLEHSLGDFTRTTRAAQDATLSYNSALEAHVGELEQVSTAGAVISELATIARLMLERTRVIEGEMKRSEQQTAALRISLEEARRSADMDHLTGLPNRRAFEALLPIEIEHARRAGQPLCVVMCDIDNFKRVNDAHGHDAGDRVLRVVAQALDALSDDTCHVARHGGEEFILLMRGRTLDQAWAEIDAARQAMVERRLINRATDEPFGRISFSAGVADVFAYEDASAALKAADTALYDAKNWGRNCVMRAERSVKAGN